MAFESTDTVRDIVRQHPDAVPVFENFGIDYCCGGGKSLEEVCNSRNISLDNLLLDLASAIESKSPADGSKWANAALGELVDHVVNQHHSYAKRELPRLTSLAAKVHQRHGHLYPELNQLQELVNALASEMSTHMFKEEQVLFPRVKSIEHAASTGARVDTAFWGSLLHPIRRMMAEHDDTGQVLRSIRELTHDYKLPDHACMSHQALYHGLAAFERDTHWHVHLENNILFPRALEFEKTQ